MTSVDALLEFLAHKPLADLAMMAQTPRETEACLRDDYLPEADTGEEDISPDSQESAEAASLEGQYIPEARRTWRKLSPEAQAALWNIFASSTGPTTMESLAGHLSPDSS